MATMAVVTAMFVSSLVNSSESPQMVSDRPIEITLLPERQRGPGGPRYRAVYSDDPKGLVGYGTTLREARLDLQKQSARSDVRAFAGTRRTGGFIGGLGQDA